MAARYWVGGTGTWTNGNTANWSATSGGAGGASVPTTADDAFFDSASGTGTCTTSATTPAVNSINLQSGASVSLVQGGTLSVVQSITFNAGTSFTPGTNQINITGTSVSLTANGNFTFYNVSFTSTSLKNVSIDGGNNGLSTITFNNLTFTAPAVANRGTSFLYLYCNISVSNTLSCAGSADPESRCALFADSRITSTVTAGTLSGNNCDYRGITLAGGASGSSPSGAGDCGGNANINFPAPKTVYRVTNATTWPAPLSWAATSGGAGSSANFPLAQDTAVVDNNTGALGGPLNMGVGYNCGAFDCSTRTTAITLNYGGTTWHKSHTLSASVSLTGASTETFSGAGVLLLTTAGKTLPFAISVDAPYGGTVRLADDLTTNTEFFLYAGTFDANNKNVNIGNYFRSSSTSTRSLVMGSGTWSLGGTGTVWQISFTGFTINAGTSNIVLTDASASPRSFDGGGYSYNKLTIGGLTGSSSTTITNSGGSFSELASTKTVAHTVFVALGTVGTWSITGSPGNVVTLRSTSGGTRTNFTLTNKTSGINYLDVRDIGELSGNKFAVGVNSIDSGNNFNVYFAATPPVPGNGLFFGSNF